MNCELFYSFIFLEDNQGHISEKSGWTQAFEFVLGNFSAKKSQLAGAVIN